MAHITYRCDVCCSEMLTRLPLDAPNVCLICRLSAEEASSAAAKPRVSFRTPVLYRSRKSRATRDVTTLLAPR